MLDTEDINKELREKFNEIRRKKVFAMDMALHLVQFDRHYILFVGHRWRKDLGIVVRQLHKQDAVGRSDYAKYLWEKSSFK